MMSPRRPLVALLIGALLSLSALAHASPPDPDWLGGLWDNGDYDDIILLVTSGVGIADSHSTDDTRPVVVISFFIAPPDRASLPARPLFASPTRAPPSV
jgi:hypothetical protein